MTDEELGPYRKVDQAVVERDRFWAQVRRRHPDVDIVLLEPAGDAEDALGQPTVAIETVRSVADELTQAWRSIVSVVADRGSVQAPAVRWGIGAGGHALLVEKALQGLGSHAGAGLLRDIAFRIGADGWRMRPTTRDDRPLLRATNGLLDLQAEAGAGATVLTLATGVMPVAEADRVVVRADVRGEVESWA
ncbi:MULTISPECIES: hypothetical protein [Nocardioides]|uniref:Uncharacterized protein n=1 Tax=Nocardioides vastitatis TaxID=2568655 RepID=A0ABW0ZEA7_9ACTN|nr:hypothetical protein [Nocardioides sp.]THI96923.1 hypothetical protein E7Z54_15610 [Nocardioides sp.]